MSKKAIFWALGIIGASTAGVFIYRCQVPPKVIILQYDKLKKKGRFKFSGHENPFGIGTGVSVQGRCKWGLITGYDGNEIYFKLYKDGEFVEKVKTIKA